MASCSSRALVLFVAVGVAAVVGTAHGASYTVGAPAGSWDLRTNYANWASSINFRAGDDLVFKYTRGLHDVVEVSKAGYDSCSASSPIATFQTGDDTVPLPAGGVTRYFICSLPGHGDAGMKLAVRVEAAAGPSTPVVPAPTPTTPRAAGPSAAVPPSSNPGASSAGSVGSSLAVAVLGLAAVVAGLMAF